MRRLALLACLAVIACARETPQQRLERLMRDILIADTHIDTPGYVVDEGYRMGEVHDYYETDIPRLRRGGVGAVFFGVYAQPEDYAPHLAVRRAFEWIDAVHEEARRNPRDLEVVTSAEGILRARRAGKVAALLGLEGGHLMADNLAMLRTYFRLGVRYMTLTHFRNNEWADSSTDTPAHNGLSAFGREVVREMNRLGMMVDISHVSDKTFYDALEVSRAPVMASHSSLRALCDIPRNMSDDLLRALARKGGVVFINFNAAYLDPGAAGVFTPLRGPRDTEIAAMMAANRDNPRRWEMKRAIQKRYRERLPKVGIEAVLRHIDRAAKLIGADHVGLGSDFDGISGMAPVGLEDVTKYPALVEGLIGMGYSDTDIRKIMGANLLRLMRAAEDTALRPAQ